MELKDPRPAPPGNGEAEEKLRLHGHTTFGHACASWQTNWGGKRNGWIEDYLPTPAIISEPGKVEGMIWIEKHFQILLMSALIAEMFNLPYTILLLKMSP